MTFLLTAGQVSDIRGAECLLPTLPAAETLLADKGYDSDRFRAALTRRDIRPCIPGRVHRKNPIAYAPDLYKHRTRIERMFGRLKDWRRIATRYDRCAHTFFSAICLEGVRNFWQPVDLIEVFHGVAQYRLPRSLLQVSDFSEENKS